VVGGIVDVVVVAATVVGTVVGAAEPLPPLQPAPANAHPATRTTAATRPPNLVTLERSGHVVTGAMVGQHRTHVGDHVGVGRRLVSR
jgi:F420-0:gamma-glutamyl ligase